MTEQYDEFIRELQKLPDFDRLPLPDSVRERLNIPLLYKNMGIVESVSRTLDNTHEYVNAGKIEIRDLTNEKIEFPAIPETHYMLDELETITTCYGPTGTNDITIDEISSCIPSPPPPSLDTPTGSNDSMPQPLVDLSNSHPCQNDD